MTLSGSTISEKQLLNAITIVLSNYITETDPYILFNGLLDTLLDITNSEYGFIGEVFYTPDKQPYIKSYATTNISWNKETRDLYHKTKRKGMLFSRFDSLYGAVLKTGQLVVSNQPTADPRSCGLPHGHPPLNSFLGIPFYGGGELLGVVGIANRKKGYHISLAESLQPFLTSCGNLIQAYRQNLKNQQIEAELCKYKERLLILDKSISLGAGYSFTPSAQTLFHHGEAILLTKKELKLLEILALNHNTPVSSITIENHVWQGVLVGESSLRSLLLRLRKKLPDLLIKTISGLGYMLMTSH